MSQTPSQRPAPATLKRYFLLAAAMLWFSVGHAQTIDHVDAVFNVSINNKPTEGENRLKVEHDGARYRVNFVLDHWLVAAHQDATFDMQDCKVRPVSYTETTKRPLKSETTQKLTFDWTGRRATTTGGDGTKEFALDEALYDPISLFFEARCGLMNGDTEFSYTVIRKGSKREQRYRVVATQTVKTGQGEFEALVVERDRKNKKRQTRLYVAPDLGFLLVRIEHQESSLLKVVATLNHMDYQLIEDSE